MVTNKNIERLIEIGVVQSFVARHMLAAKLCRHNDDYSLLLFRAPYFVEFRDTLIENYLEITLADLETGLLITGSSALAISLELGLQDLQVLRARNFDNDPLIKIFLSFQSQKMRNLYSFLEAIDKLLLGIRSGGLSTLQDGSFDPRFDFSQSLSALYPGLREEYLRCV